MDYSALLKPAARISAANLAASAPPRDKTREKKRLNTSVATLNNGSGRALLGGRRGRGGGGGGERAVRRSTRVMLLYSGALYVLSLLTFFFLSLQ